MQLFFMIFSVNLKENKKMLIFIKEQTQ